MLVYSLTCNYQLCLCSRLTYRFMYLECRYIILYIKKQYILCLDVNHYR